METGGIGGFSDIRRGLLNQARSTPETKENNLSEAEQKMIRREFKPGNTAIDLYGSTGEVRSENPGAKGGNIDFTV